MMKKKNALHIDFVLYIRLLLFCFAGVSGPPAKRQKVDEKRPAPNPFPEQPKPSAEDTFAAMQVALSLSSLHLQFEGVHIKYLLLLNRPDLEIPALGAAGHIQV